MAKQFYETYRGNKRVAAMLRQLPWTHHELDGQIKAVLFERVVPHPVKLSTMLREVHPQKFSLENIRVRQR